MRGAIPPIPQYAFMARCSVKAKGQLYIYLTGVTAYLLYLSVKTAVISAVVLATLNLICSIKAASCCCLHHFSTYCAELLLF
jgi:hypothetical protein